LSTEKSNCEISGNLFWLKATRDIEAGEEIFVHYGFQFWSVH
jgi:SET domain-containing protein